MQQCFVYDGSAPVRLDVLLVDFLASELEEAEYSRSQVKQWIEQGSVSVNDKIISKAGFAVPPGGQIAFSLPKARPSTLEPYDFPLSIFYEDEQLLVVDKPPGLVVHPGAGNRSGTLLNAVVHYCQTRGVDLRQFADTQRLGLVHRLDKDTSGLLVVAKTQKAHTCLSEQFQQRSVGRTYTGLVLVTPRARRMVQQTERGCIDARIGRHRSKRTLMAVVEQGGRLAKTHWERVESFRYACLLSLRLETGRTHQIRVHMDSVASPVIGDPVYGDFSALPDALRKASDRFARQALHARSLAFEHPTSGERLEFESALPTDLNQLVETFRSYDN